MKTSVKHFGLAVAP